MAGRSDIQVRIDSQSNDQGFKSAEASAKVLARELDKLEAAQRSLVQQELAAYRESEQIQARRRADIQARGRLEDAAHRENAGRMAEAERRTRAMAAVEAAAYRDQERMAAEAAAAIEAGNERQRTAMEQTGTAMLGIGTAAVVGLGLATKSAMDWESAWAGVRKTVDGSPEQMAALEGELRGLAKTLPATHEEIAGVAEAAGQLGVARADIASFTKTAIDMGESTNLSAEEAATGLAQLGNVMGVLPSEANRAGSALVALGNDGASTEADILAMSLRIAGAGRTIGLTQAQVMGFASGLSSVGIEAEAGGSAISRVFVDIAQSVETGDDKLADFAKVAGVSTSEFAAAFREDAAGATLDFIEGLGRMQEAGGNVFGTLEQLELGEIRVRDALLRTAGASDMLRESVALGTTAWDENLALAREAATRYQTAESQIAIARNTLNDTAIDIGAVLLPALATGATAVSQLVSAFQSLPQGAQEFAVGLGAAAASAALLGGAALVAIPKMAEMSRVMQDLSVGSSGLGRATGAMGRGLGVVTGALAGPWGLALAAGVTVLGYFAVKHAETAQRVDQLASSLDAQTGAITDQTRALAINRLEEEGALDAAERLGISLADVTDAALGQADAQSVVAEALARVNNEAAGYSGGDFGGTVSADAEAAHLLQGAVGGLGDELSDAEEVARRKAEAMGEDATATEGAAEAADAAAGATAGMVDPLAEAGEEALTAGDAVDALSEALTGLLAGALGVEEAADGLTSAYANLAANAEEQERTLVGNGEAALANRDAVRGLVEGVYQLAQAQAEGGASMDEVSASLAEQRDRLQETLVAMGFNADEAARYADMINPARDAAAALAEATQQIPATAATEVSQPGMPQAQSAAENLRDLVTQVPDEKRTSVSQPGMTKAQSDVEELRRRTEKVPDVKRTSVSQPGMGQSLAQSSDLWARLNRLPGLTNSRIATPGAVVAAQQAGAADRAVRNILARKTSIIGVDDQISARVRAAQAVIDGLRGKTVTITTNRVETRTLRTVQGSSVRSTVSAEGNLFLPGDAVLARAYAGGGTWGARDPLDLPNAHPPHVAPAGSWRVFGEEETQGEVYLPLADDWRRPRAEELLAQTADRFGFDLVQRFAAGALVAGPPAVATGRAAPVAAQVRVVEVATHLTVVDREGAVIAAMEVTADRRVQAGIAAYDRAETLGATYNPGG